MTEAPPAPQVAAYHQAPARGRVALPDLAQLGLGGFAAGLTGLVLLIIAAESAVEVISGNESLLPTIFYGAAALSCALAAASLISPRLHIPGARFLPLGAAAAGLLLEVSAPASAGVAGTPPEAVILAGLVTLTAAVAVGVRTAAVLVLGLALLLGVGSLPERASDAVAVTHLAATLVAMQVLLTGGVSLLLVIGLRRGANRAAVAAARLDDGLARDAAASAAAEADAEAARTLHDTALNTLEALAKGGAALDLGMVRARCRADLTALQQWREGATSQDMKAALGVLEAHAHRLGVDLEFRVGESADRAVVPPSVTAAFLGAARELVTNVAKHSGTDHAEIQVWHDADGLWVAVADRGVGLGEQSGTGKYGLAESVVSRVSAVGGQVTFAPGPDGCGTTCELHWAAEPEVGFDLEPVDLNLLAVWILTLAGLLAAASLGLVVLLGWTSFQQPWIALGAALASGAALFAAGNSLRRGYQPGAAAAVAAVMTYLALSWAALLADPVCSSISGDLVGLDARLFLLAVVLLFLPRFTQAVLLIVAVVAGQYVTDWLWRSTFDLCGSRASSAAFVTGAVLLAIWWFGRLATGLSSDFARSRADALAVQIRTNCNEQARLERQRWAQDALAGAERILMGLVDGTQELGSMDLAHRCKEEAGFLRGMLLVGAAPRDQARTMRRWLGRVRRAGLQVVVRGSFRGFDPPSAIAEEVEGLVFALTTMHGPGRVSLLAWGGAGGSGLSLEAQHPRASGLSTLPQLGVVDAAEGTLTAIWDWSGDPAARPSAEPAQAGLHT